jgi:hypothetical protein
MSPQIYSGFPTHFQQIFAPLCVVRAEICILLFFLASNSKFKQLLITHNEISSNLQRRFTNQIQREFLFNNCIQSQNLFSASKCPRKKTNLFKRRPASLARSREGVLSILPRPHLPFCPNTRLEAQGSATYNARTKI